MTLIGLETGAPIPLPTRLQARGAIPFGPFRPWPFRIDRVDLTLSSLRDAAMQVIKLPEYMS